MLRIAICDDEPIMRDTVKRSLDNYSRLRNLDIVYDQFKNGADFLRSKKQYNVVILDYQFDEVPGHNGLSIAKRLRKSNMDTAIIFLTSYPKIVFSSFEVDTFRFLVKPLNPEKLFQALDDFLKTLEKDATLMIRIEGATNVINTGKLLYLEGDGKYCTLYMLSSGEPVECHETLASVEQRLPQHLFFRCHRSYIVNLKHIDSYDHQEIVLRNGDRVFISRNKYKPFENAFIEYSMRYGY